MNAEFVREPKSPSPSSSLVNPRLPAFTAGAVGTVTFGRLQLNTSTSNRLRAVGIWVIVLRIAYGPAR
jgi:hypothetical protein